jgi:hypothetical protein
MLREEYIGAASDVRCSGRKAAGVIVAGLLDETGTKRAFVHVRKVSADWDQRETKREGTMERGADQDHAIAPAGPSPMTLARMDAFTGIMYTCGMTRRRRAGHTHAVAVSARAANEMGVSATAAARAMVRNVTMPARISLRPVACRRIGCCVRAVRVAVHVVRGQCRSRTPTAGGATDATDGCRARTVHARLLHAERVRQRQVAEVALVAARRASGKVG